MIGAHTVITPTLVFLLKSTLSHINLAVHHSRSCCPLAFLHCSPSSQLSFVLFHLIHYWQLFCVCIECLCVCFLASLCNFCEAFCMVSHCDLFLCFVVVHFSLITTLFCFISFDTLLTTFFVCIECLCVCFLASLCNFCEAFCMVSHYDLFLC